MKNQENQLIASLKGLEAYFKTNLHLSSNQQKTLHTNNWDSDLFLSKKLSKKLSEIFHHKKAKSSNSENKY